MNCLGGVWVLRAFLPGLEAAGRADVVNIVSVAGTVAFAPAGPYSASKHAQLAFSRATAAELRGRGIHVHTVNPGFVETKGFRRRPSSAARCSAALSSAPTMSRETLLKVLERDTNETFAPRLVQSAALAQALSPGLVARLAGRSGYRRD